VGLAAVVAVLAVVFAFAGTHTLNRWPVPSCW
jgi:hypothetical protein